MTTKPEAPSPADWDQFSLWMELDDKYREAIRLATIAEKAAAKRMTTKSKNAAEALWHRVGEMRAKLAEIEAETPF